MAVVRTEAQREASRINGRKSRGPTEAGKRASRCNGLREGHFATTVLPEGRQGELDAKLAVYEEAFRPRTEYERDLVRTAAVAQVRIDGLQRVEISDGEDRARHAVERWDEAREEEVDLWVDLLETDPLRAVRRLLRTAEGCDRMTQLWQTLAVTLERSDGWDEASTQRALRLSGLEAPPEPCEWPVLAEVFGHARALRIDSEVEPAEAPGDTPPDREASRAALREFVAGEIARLEGLADDLWEQYDAPDREAAPVRAIFDDSARGRTLRRALADAERLRRRALDELARHRAEPSKAAPAPEPRSESAPAPSLPARSEPGPIATPRPPARSEPGPILPPGLAPALATHRFRLEDDLDDLRAAFVPVSIAPTRRS